jgi:hypothetical protein
MLVSAVLVGHRYQRNYQQFCWLQPDHSGLRWTKYSIYIIVFTLFSDVFAHIRTAIWCPWPGSNQHSLRNSILSRARLPIPPQGHAREGPVASGGTIASKPPGSTRKIGAATWKSVSRQSLQVFCGAPCGCRPDCHSADAPKTHSSSKFGMRSRAQIACAGPPCRDIPRSQDPGPCPAAERWQSGRSHRTRNAEYPQGYRGFKSLPLRQTQSN